jgi:prepilin-type N-terminal cleavage/methylation domain-containing protein
MMLTKIQKAIARIFQHNERGFTLLEELVSMIIFAVGVLMLVPMIVTTQKGNIFADWTTKAAHHIQAKIEEIKNTHNFTSGHDHPEGMTRTWTVEDYNAFLKKIKVEMTWLDKERLEHHNITVTYESHN